MPWPRCARAAADAALKDAQEKQAQISGQLDAAKKAEADFIAAKADQEAATTFVSGAITSTVLAAGSIHSTIFTTGAIVATTFAGVIPANFSTMSISAAGLVGITSSIKQNAVHTGFMFVMTDMTTHVPAAGLTVVGTRSIDGAAFAPTANSPAGVASGIYAIDLAAADTNGRHIMLRFTNATADDTNVEIITQP